MRLAYEQTGFPNFCAEHLIEAMEQNSATGLSETEQ